MKDADMKTQKAFGTLKVTNADKINEIGHHKVWAATAKHSLIILVNYNILWDLGILEISRQDSVQDGEAAANEFIKKLAAILTEDGIPELGLKGEIILVTSDDDFNEDTVIRRILIENNQALHSQADFNWENYTIAGS
jgi:hypothetical protein